MSLEFDPDTHIYRFEGRRIPGVTEILKDAGLIDAQWFTEESAEWGTRLHSLLQYEDEGTLDQETLDLEYLPYLEAWRGYKHDFPFTILEIEKPMAMTSHPQFAGTLDRVIHPKNFMHDVILEIKTGEPKPADIVQACAYQMLLGPAETAAPRVVYLNPTLPIPYLHRRINLLDVMMETCTFQHALNLWHWRNQHGLIRAE